MLVWIVKKQKSCSFEDPELFIFQHKDEAEQYMEHARQADEFVDFQFRYSIEYYRVIDRRARAENLVKMQAILKGGSV